MTQITFITSDSEQVVIDAEYGDCVMELARSNDIDGITAECGGEMMCATCHVYVHENWLEKTGEAPEDERELLDFASCEIKETSRLACQIKISEKLDGLVLYLPESQV